MKVKQRQRHILKVLEGYELTALEIKQDIKLQLGRKYNSGKICGALKALVYEGVVTCRLEEGTDRRKRPVSFYSISQEDHNEL